MMKVPEEEGFMMPQMLKERGTWHLGKQGNGTWALEDAGRELGEERLRML